ncbi:ABC transporter permease [Paenibacillus sp. GCM10027626]|uniref:ABC transporter permease n=1 Tax=Paenibacillus sp. GCM10027626 TaxID=3273411 RepID=UPI00363A1D0C
MGKDIWFLVKTTLLVTLRKRKNLILYIGLPIAGILVSALLYGSQGSAILHVGVVNSDGEQFIAADTIRFLQNLDNIELVDVSKSELKEQLAANRLDSGLILDAGFSQSVQSGHPDHIGIESVKGAQVTMYMKSMLRGYIDNVSAIGKIAGADDTKFQELYDRYRGSDFKLAVQSVNDTATTKEMSYQSIGFLLMFMMMSAVNLSELILKNRENRTYLRILSSPISARTYVLSNIIVNLVIMMIQISVALLCMRFVFNITTGIPLNAMFGLLGLFALVSVSVSLVIVAFAKSSASAGALQNLIVIPTCLLSGCFFPISIMPQTLRHVSSFLPQNWVLQSFSKLQAGEGLSSVGFNIMILLVFAAVFFLIATYKFGRNNDTRNFV